jgi:peptide subunit release factor 1 (eRF1)
MTAEAVVPIVADLARGAGALVRLLLERAAGLLRDRGDADVEAELQAVLTEAAKGGQAVAGLDETLEAVARGAVHRLYLLKGFCEAGGACPACGRLQPSAASPCRGCGAVTDAAELGARMVARVTAARGTVAVVDTHAALARVGGVAARLRYPL